jgi:hypothetical protein
MKVIFNEQEYRIRFKHINDTKDKKADHRSTTCSIEDTAGNVYASGEAKVNPRDNFNKEIGRNLALRRATSKTSGLPGGLIQEIWKTYTNRV